ASCVPCHRWNLFGFATLGHRWSDLAAASLDRGAISSDGRHASYGTPFVEPCARHCYERDHHARVGWIRHLAGYCIADPQRSAAFSLALGRGTLGYECSRLRALVLAARWRRTNGA